MRLIDADKFYIAWFDPNGQRLKIKDVDGFPIMVSLEDLQKSIKAQPLIDAVPVVRCKDCKHYCSNGVCWEINEALPTAVEDDGYCSHGEQK